MPPETSQTLDRGLQVLAHLSQADDGLTVTDLAAGLGVSRTVVYRLVVTLEQHGMLRRSADGRCRLGLAVLGLARQVQPVLRDAAVPPLRRLAESVGAIAHLTVLDSGEALAIAVVEPSRDYPISFRVGARQRLDQGAAGKALLAARDSEGRPLEPGWIVAMSETSPGTVEISSPLLGVGGLEASVGVIAVAELSVEDVGPRVVRAAGEVARALR